MLLLPSDTTGKYVRSKWLATSNGDQRDGWCVIGMNFARVDPFDPDTIRMNALQTMYPHTRVWGVSVCTDVEETPTWQRGDVRSNRFWKGWCRTFPRCNTKLVVIDYRWCPSIYWNPFVLVGGLGYGDRWFSHHIPAFFKAGGLVFILPNDIEGKVLGMYRRLTTTAKTDTLHLCYSFLTARQNPLYNATEVAWCQSNGASWTATNVSRARESFSHVKSLRYCDPLHPFIVCYQLGRTTDDGKTFTDHESVMRWINTFHY